jgi:uncharacterized protein YndB with AHSA1/START domain
MTRGLVATASVDVEAPADTVWAALIDPQTIEQYLPGTEVVSDWKPGSPVVWKGVYEGQPFEDKGVVLEVDPGRRLRYSHFSPLTGKPDLPEHYHTVTLELTPGAGPGGPTRLTLSQDNNPDEEARDHSAAFWGQMLERLKAVLES